ncbi:MAG: heavy metal-binding domain-containing protein [Thermomicrobiales bacterium]
MILTTTSHLDGRPIQRYLGLVTGEAILGANVFRDVLAGVRDVIGGRSGSYEKELRRAKELAVQEMSEQAAAAGANAIIGIDLDYESLGANGSMLMVTASGTAVFCEGLSPS